MPNHRDHRSDSPSPDNNNIDTSLLLPGFPGYRTRSGRTGLDYIDTQCEMAHMAGVFIRQLFTGTWRQSGTSPWITLMVGGIVLMTYIGKGTICLAILIAMGIVLVTSIRNRTATTEQKTGMDWIEFLNQIYADNADNIAITPVFVPGASDEEIQAAEERLDTKFPNALRELMGQTNGLGEELIDENEQRAIELGSFLLSVNNIVKTTEYYRNSDFESNIDFTEMIYFLDPRVDMIYFAMREGEDSVYTWNPVDHQFRPVADDLEEFFNGWLSGAITI